MKLLLLFVLIKLSLGANYVSIYTGPDFTGIGENIYLNPTCNSITSPDLAGSVRSMNSHNNCVNIYTQENCRGKYLLVKPGSPAHNNLDYYELGSDFHSIGPCYESCHPDTVHTENGSTVIKFYGAPSSHESPIFSKRLQSNHCTDISSEMEDWTSPVFRSYVENIGACVELHEFSNCSGSVLHLSVGPNVKKGIIYWTNPDKSRSVSFCGYNCGSLINVVDPVYDILETNSTEDELGQIRIKLFEFTAFRGNWTEMEVDIKCRAVKTNLNQFRSAIIYAMDGKDPKSSSVAFYKRAGCGEKDKVLVINKMDVYNSPINTFELKFMKLVDNLPEKESLTYDEESGGGIVAIVLIVVIVCSIGMIIGARYWWLKKKPSVSNFVGLLKINSRGNDNVRFENLERHENFFEEKREAADDRLIDVEFEEQ